MLEHIHTNTHKYMQITRTYTRIHAHAYVQKTDVVILELCDATGCTSFVRRSLDVDETRASRKLLQSGVDVKYQVCRRV